MDEPDDNDDDDDDDDDDVLNMSTSKKLLFRQELTFAYIAILWSFPRNLSPAKL